MQALRRYASIAAAALVAGAAAAGAAAQTGYRVQIAIDSAQWRQLEPAGTDSRVSVLEFVPPGETGESWTRFLSVQLFSEDAAPYPGGDEALSECRRFLTTRCPSAQWTVLGGTRDEPIYEWRVAGCAAEPDQQEVGRLLSRPGAWGRVTFSVKGRMDEATRQDWYRRLLAARIVAREP